MPILERKVLGIMMLLCMRKLGHLIQQFLLRPVTWNKDQSSIWSLFTSADEVAVLVMGVALVVEPARHRTRNNSASYSANVAEAQVIHSGFLVLAVNEGDVDFLVWVAFAHGQEIAGCGVGGVGWWWATGRWLILADGTWFESHTIQNMPALAQHALVLLPAPELSDYRRNGIASWVVDVQTCLLFLTELLFLVDWSL